LHPELLIGSCPQKLRESGEATSGEEWAAAVSFEVMELVNEPYQVGLADGLWGKLRPAEFEAPLDEKQEEPRRPDPPFFDRFRFDFVKLSGSLDSKRHTVILAQ
jgi:hypothetical protein